MAKVNNKPTLHLRNRNRNQYDLGALVGVVPELKKYIVLNKIGKKTINFAQPMAVRLLNKAILKHYYKIEFWEFPQKNLCPPIPGRAEYIHYIADLIGKDKASVKCLDIGTGANCIYPIIGVVEYNWQFIASEIDEKSIESAKKIIESNKVLKGNISLRKQSNLQHIFKGIVQPTDKFDVSICNPPFHASMAEAQRGTKRKVRNLTGKKTNKPTLNFSGQLNELIYQGGELQFIGNMINESKLFAKNCQWFTTLVSKEANLKKLYARVEKQSPNDLKIIDIGVGNKKSRVLAWTFM